VIVITLGRGERQPRFLPLALLCAAEPVRIWVLLTLRSRWVCGGAVPVDGAIATGGPYRFVRHPNYAVVLVELVMLPVTFGLRRFAAAVALIALVLFAVRIQQEEELLFRIPEYAEHFRSKKRLIPGVW
jgi:methyltransferase